VNEEIMAFAAKLADQSRQLATGPGDSPVNPIEAATFTASTA
jgi:hypothetical protein